MEVGRCEFQNRQITFLLEKYFTFFHRYIPKSALCGKHHFACPDEEEKGEKGALPAIQRTRRRWEKGHRMALSSGSSVSEDVWTLIKMCRASGRVPFLSFILPLSSPLPSSCLILRTAASCARDVVCVRSHANGIACDF